MCFCTGLINHRRVHRKTHHPSLVLHLLQHGLHVLTHLQICETKNKKKKNHCCLLSFYLYEHYTILTVEPPSPLTCFTGLGFIVCFLFGQKGFRSTHSNVYQVTVILNALHTTAETLKPQRKFHPALCSSCSSSTHRSSLTPHISHIRKDLHRCSTSGEFITLVWTTNDNYTFILTFSYSGFSLGFYLNSQREKIQRGSFCKNWNSSLGNSSPLSRTMTPNPRPKQRWNG